MYYINAISSISHLPSFNNSGFSADIENLQPSPEPVIPVFKKYIDPKQLRRMSSILRMSVACAKDCMDQSDMDPEAIIVGTGFGCLTDTQKFLDTLLTVEGILPPTSFIQSTHNTIAGQVSLVLQNQSYNTTYTQNTISFELALADAMLLLDEGTNNVLLGAADEFISFLKEFGYDHLNLTSGTTFLMLSKYKSPHSIAAIVGSSSYFKPTSVESVIEAFLATFSTSYQELDHLYYSHSFKEESISLTFPAGVSSVDFTRFTGAYPTNVALGLHIAVDQLMLNKASQILLCNALNPDHLGLTLIVAI